MQPVVYLDKLRRPEIRALSRHRLEHLVLSTEGRPLTLVLGPAGSGKTTLLAGVAERARAPVAWYRASEDDADEGSLVRHLAHAVRLATGQEPTPAVLSPAQETVEALVWWLSSLEDSLLLAIDDLHEIAGTAAERALSRLILHRPPRLRLVLASRRSPAINTSRLLVSGELCQIESEDLRFRFWEVEELFRAFYQEPLSPESAAALTRRTGGWAAGLQLFHLSTSRMQRVDRERAVDRLTGSSRLIRSYLTRNVLEGLDDERRDFLLRTSTLGLMTAQTCDRLLGTAGSAAVLSELEEEQFFTSSDDGGQCFRYHQVLQSHLEGALVDELGADRARALYARAGSLLEQAAEPAAAIRAFVHAEDWGAVARLLRVSTQTTPDDDPLWLLHAMTSSQTEDSALVEAGARQLLRKGSIVQAVAAYDRAVELADDVALRSRCSTARAVASVWLPQHQDALTGQVPDRRLQLAYELRRATVTVHDADAPGGPLVRGLRSLLGGRADLARKSFTQAEQDPTAGLVERLAARFGVLTATSAFWQPSDELCDFEALLADAEAANQPWLSRMTRGWRSAHLLVTDPEPWRSGACFDLLDDCDRDGDAWGACLLSIVVGVAHLALGRTEPAGAALRRARATAEELGAPVLALWASALLGLSQPDGATDAASAAALEVTAAQLGVSWATLHQCATGSPPGRVVAAPLAASSVQPSARPVPGRPVPPEITVRCLGGFEVTVGSRAVDVQQLRPRARGVLMMLALHHGRSLHREHLVDVFWPDASLASGIRTLQVAVSSVRQCLASAGLPDDALRRYGTAYALQLVGARDQRADFDAQARAAERVSTTRDPRGGMERRLAALDLYAGDLLPEVGPAEWVVGERDRLRQVAARLGSEAAELALDLGELRMGIRAARRSLDLAPYQDVTWLLLAALQERLGDHTAAEVTRREHARVSAELMLPPALADPLVTAGPPNHRPRAPSRPLPRRRR